MKKLITFRTLKSICAFLYTNDCLTECENDNNLTEKCSDKVCPVWKKLKEVKP